MILTRFENDPNFLWCFSCRLSKTVSKCHRITSGTVQLAGIALHFDGVQYGNGICRKGRCQGQYRFAPISITFGMRCGAWRGSLSPSIAAEESVAKPHTYGESCYVVAVLTTPQRFDTVVPRFVESPAERGITQQPPRHSASCEPSVQLPRVPLCMRRSRRALS
jgi:hypothetical protein